MSFKTNFLPSEEVSAARRKAVFGTESKAVAGLAIGITAGALIAAGPKVIGTALIKGGKAVAKSAGKTIAANPVKSTIIGLVAVPAVVKSPELRKDALNVAKNAPGELINIGGGVGESYSQFRTGDIKGGFSTLGSTLKDNPTGAVIIGAGLAVSSAAAAYYTGKTFLDAAGNQVDNEKEYQDYINKLKSNMPPIPTEPPNPEKKDKDKKDITTIPPPNYVDDKNNYSTQTGGASTPQPSSNATPVNIQQNNYFGDKTIKKYINTA